MLSFSIVLFLIFYFYVSYLMLLHCKSCNLIYSCKYLSEVDVGEVGRDGGGIGGRRRENNGSQVADHFVVRGYLVYLQGLVVVDGVGEVTIQYDTIRYNTIQTQTFL